MERTSTREHFPRIKPTKYVILNRFTNSVTPLLPKSTTQARTKESITLTKWITITSQEGTKVNQIILELSNKDQ